MTQRMHKLKFMESSKGFTYLYGIDLIETRRVIRKCATYLKGKHFDEIVTPSVVDYSLVVGSYDRPVSTANADKVFQLATSTDERFALRYENTLPICKFFVDNLASEGHPAPRRLFYISTQFRNETTVALNSRLRQFNQVGWEILGGNTRTNVVDAVRTGSEILTTLGLQHTVCISEVNILGDVLDKLAMNRSDRRVLLDIFDDKAEDRLSNFMDASELAEDQKRLLIALFEAKGKTARVLQGLTSILKSGGHESALVRVDRIVEIVDALRETPLQHIEVDFGLVRSNRFYSGIIFQYYIGESNHECGGGGEYDRIIKSLGGEDAIACGAAFGLERVVDECRRCRRGD